MKKDLKYFLFIEVLQNGETLASFSRPVSKSGGLNIGPSKRAHMHIPFFPISQDLELFYLHKKGVHLSIEPGWEGFVNTKNERISIQEEDRRVRTIDLANGDYGSIFFDDLQIIFRVGKSLERKTKIVRNRSYQPRLTSLVIHSKIEAQILAAAVLLTFVLLGPAVGFLYNMGDSRPEKLADLDPIYLEPFVNPKHLETLPEAMKTNIDRTNYYRSALTYYDSLTSMLLGWEPVGSSMYDSSKNYYAKLHSQQGDSIQEKLDKQKKTEEFVLKKPQSSIIEIPIVKGESINGSILRVFDKTAHLHSNFEALLTMRRKIQAEFPRDPNFDPRNFKGTGKKNLNKLGNLAKIDSFNIETDEEAMYSKALRLGKSAKIARSKMTKRSEEVELLTALTPGPIAVPPAVKFVSFLSNASLLAEDGKMDEIMSSKFGKRGKKKIKEPLIGEIEPRLIERTISKNKYELQLCYELALRRNQNAGGKMEWSWRIDTRGKISDVNLLSTSIKDKGMVRCVRQKISRWGFPRPRRGSVEVTYPFHFSKSRG